MKDLQNLTVAAGLLSGIWISVAPMANSAVTNCPPLDMPSAPPGMMGPRRLPPPLRDADANGDGIVTRAEIDQSTKTRFDKADANHDDSVSPAEFEENAPPRFLFGDPSELFKRLDANEDAKLSPEEFNAPIRAMACRIDHDGDGAITPAEVEVPPPQ